MKTTIVRSADHVSEFCLVFSLIVVVTAVSVIVEHIRFVYSKWKVQIFLNILIWRIENS